MYRTFVVGWSAFLIVAVGCGEVTNARDAGNGADAAPVDDGGANVTPDSGVVDSTAPDTTITSSPAALTQSRDVSFAFESSEAGSTFMCRIDTNAFAACNSPHLATVADDGSHVFDVYATDAAGNDDATPASAAFAVDTQAPGVTIVSGPANPTSATSASFEFTVDEAATSTCDLDGGGFAGCTPGTAVVYPGALPDSTHTFTVRAEDPAGNVTTETYSWSIDSSAPTIAINTTPNAVTNQTSAAFTFTADAGTTVTCSLDNGVTFTACASATTMSYPGPLSDGPHTFYVKATNAVSSFSTVTYTWTVDTKDPVVTFASTPANPTASSSGSFTFNVDEAASVGCRLGATGSYGACDTATTYAVSGLTGNPATQYTVAVRATDAAGNQGTASYTWTVDREGPTVTISSAPGDPFPVDYGDFGFSSAESGTTFRCRVDSASAYVPCNSGSYTKSRLGYGTHRFYVYGTDALGNDGPIVVHDWRAQQDLVLYYKFDGDLRNSSPTGAAHDGDGGGIDFIGGVVKGAVEFGGDGAVAKLKDTLRPLSSPTDTEYSIGFWVREFKPIFDNKPRYFLNFRASGGGLSLHRIYANDFEMWAGITDDRGQDSDLRDYTSQYGTWKHIAFTYPNSRGTNGVDMHVDGVLERTIPAVSGDVFSTDMAPDMLLGQDNFIHMDELKVYNRALKEAERCTLLIGGTWGSGTCKLPPLP